jgi:Aspartyl protease
MPCLSAKYDPKIGPLINVALLPPGSFKPGTQLKASGFPALIDTGASGSCISPDVATQLHLTQIGKRPMISATHETPMNIYLVDLILPFGGTAIALNSVQVSEFHTPTNSPFKVIIGRDIICKGTLTISFDGHFTFCL